MTETDVTRISNQSPIVIGGLRRPQNNTCHTTTIDGGGVGKMAAKSC